MKPSTEALFASAMEMNADIQDDNLIMLDKSNDLRREARFINKLNNVKAMIEANGIDKTVLKFLDITIDFSSKLGIDKNTLSWSKEDCIAYFSSKINAYISSSKESIHADLTKMLEASMCDINARCEFGKASKLTTDRVVIYNRMAIENLCDTFNHITQNVSFANGYEGTYKDFLTAFTDTLESQLSMCNVAITHDGYVTINVPQPKLQTLAQASIESLADIDAMSNKLNSITYKQMMQRIGAIKLELADKINNAKDVEDVVLTTHFLAQTLMAIKNSVKLMQNYHKASIHELSEEGFFSNLKDNATMMKREFRDIAMMFTHAANVISKMGNDEISILINANIDRKMSLAKDLNRAMTIGLPLLRSIAAQVHSYPLSEHDKGVLSEISTKNQKQVNELNNLVEHNLDEYKNKSLGELGYTKQVMITNLKLGASVLNSISKGIFESVTGDAMELDITYGIDYLVTDTKFDLYAICKKIHLS